MNRYILTMIMISASICFMKNKAKACTNELPTPVISNPYTQYVGVYVSGTDGKTAYFDGSASWDSDGSIVEWKWTKGKWNGSSYYYDPAEEPVLSQHPQMTFNNDGIYEIRLTVKDNNNGSSSTVCYVHVFYTEIDSASDYSAYGSGKDFTYDILPNTHWLPDETNFYIMDSSVVKYHSSLENIAVDYPAQEFSWDGTIDAGGTLSPGIYLAIVQAGIQNSLSSYWATQLSNTYYWGWYSTKEVNMMPHIQVKVDLDIDGIDENYEEDPGGYIAVDGERKCIYLNQELLYFTQGYVVLTIANEDMDKAEIYTSSTGGMHGDYVIWDLSNYDDYYDLYDLIVYGNGLYIQGTEASDSPMDIQVRLSFYAPEDDEYENPIISDTVNFTSIKVDLDIDDVSDEIEESTGGFIALNDDDDDDNQTADKNESGPITNEDNLIAITIQKVQPEALTGNVTLKANACGSKVKIWADSTKGGSPISLSPTPPTYATPTALPQTLYVEGYDTSGDVRDIELALEYSIEGKTFDDRIKVTVFRVDIETSKNQLTLKHDREAKLEVKVIPSAISASEYKIDTRRALETTWYDLASPPTGVLDPWYAKIAGNFKLRGHAKINGSWFFTSKVRLKDIEVRFPAYSDIIGDATVAAAISGEWASTLTDCTDNPNQRRERGFWIQLNTQTNNYNTTGATVGPWVGPAQTASLNPGAKPADNPATPLPNAAGTIYTVAHFHTHTPTTYRTVGRPIGPTGADNNYYNSQNVTGIVYDYIESPAGSGNIPAGHPEGAAAQHYSSGPDRRSTP